MPILHVLNGDCTLEPLRRAGVPGAFVAWTDVLCEGPLPRTDEDSAFRAVRARYLAGGGAGEQAEILAHLTAADETLAAAAPGTEVVLWLEHDLFDQVLLARHLAWFGRRRPAPRLSLICIDLFPGVEPFHGLGQLGPGQLATLFPTRVPVTAGMTVLGTRAWDAFTAATPEGLNALLEEPTQALPFLAPAIRRYLEEYPSLDRGLSRTEQTILELLADAPGTGSELFQRAQRREERLFMGDWSFWRILGRLADGGDRALVATIPAGVRHIALATARVSLTPRGEGALAGTGTGWRPESERWIGGVALGSPPAWCWDSRRGRVVAARGGAS